MKSLLFIPLLFIQLLDSLHTRVDSLEEAGRYDEAIEANWQLMHALSENGLKNDIEYIDALIDMSYFHAQTGSLPETSRYGFEGVEATQKYIGRNLPVWVRNGDREAVEDGISLTEDAVIQCYEAIKSCYAGADKAHQRKLADNCPVDSLASALRWLHDDMMPQMLRAARNDNARAVLLRLDTMYQTVLYESLLLAAYIAVSPDTCASYALDVYTHATDPYYRLRAAMTLAGSHIARYRNDSALVWFSRAEELDSAREYEHTIRDNRAWIAAQSQDWDTALPLLQAAFTQKKQELEHDFLYMTARSRQDNWTNNYVWFFQQNLSLCGLTPHPDAVNTFLYDNTLLEKGLLLTTESAITQLLLDNGHRDLVDSLYQLRHRNAQARHLSKKNLSTDAVQLAMERKRAEQRILEICRQAGSPVQFLEQTWSDVRNELSGGEVAIEFIRTEDDRGVFYLQALILRHDWQYPRLVTLGREEPFLQARRNTALYSTPEFTEQVWSPIIATAGLQPGETVFFSPDGAFYMTGIEYLALDDEESINDRYKLVRLSSTREIRALKAKRTASKPDEIVLYGGIQYSSDSTAAQQLQYLPGSLDEVRGIKPLFTRSQVYTGTQATEASFRALSGRSPSAIHIATHGFCLTDRTVEKLSQRNVQFVSLSDRQRINLEDVGLTRSGLCFSGSGDTWSGKSTGGQYDGVLTAAEIAGLNLTHTDVVVLSACQTGLGFLTVDGVAGLQRGFKKAGVQTLIMSLWRVDDAATQLLMTEFYRHWVNDRQSKREAFHHARNAVRQRFPEPDYWAGFILLD